MPTGDLLRIQIFEGDPTAPVKTSQMKYLAAGPTVVEECPFKHRQPPYSVTKCMICTLYSVKMYLIQNVKYTLGYLN